ncbi:MAG TPA: c-type cytochrome [Steroidobacteraceae bacterium]|nr:c-type cytochrome [Steroidobacteraceae bacterium]
MCRSSYRALVLAAGLVICAATLVAAQTRTADQLVARGALSYTFYCADCHGGNGAGDAAKHVPELAGRSAASLVRDISALQDAARASRGQATNRHARVLSRLNSEQIEAIADYLASLAPPPSFTQ